MYVSIRRYQIAGSFEEFNARVSEGFVPVLRALPGFRGYYTVDCGDRRVAAVSIFESREAALASNERAREWVAANIPHILPHLIDIISGETGVALSA